MKSKKTMILNFTIQEEDKSVYLLSKLEFHDKIITFYSNNVVQLRNREILQINYIFKNKSSHANIKIAGIVYTIFDNVFNYPMASKNVGIMYVK